MVEYLERILIKRCQNQETEAFAPLMNLYKRQLFSYLLRRCGNSEPAEDLFQETLIKIWKNISKYQQREKFGSWIFSIAHNISIDYFRKQKVRNVVSLSENLDQISYNDDPWREVERTEQKELLTDALSNLSELQKEVFLLRQHGELTFREIAELMDQPLNTVLSHMNYAVKKLQKVLREENAEK